MPDTKFNLDEPNEISDIPYYSPILNMDTITDLEDCKKILKFLCGLIKPLPVCCAYKGFDEVEKYFESKRFNQK